MLTVYTKFKYVDADDIEEKIEERMVGAGRRCLSEPAEVDTKREPLGSRMTSPSSSPVKWGTGAMMLA